MNRAPALPWRDTVSTPFGPYTATTDRASWTALLDQVATGDANACATLYDRSATPAFSLIACILRDRAAAADTLRDLYVDIRDRARRGEHRDRDVSAWILSLARAAAVSRLRASSNGAFAGPGDDTSPDIHLTLSDDQRTILLMIYFRGLTVREAAVRLGRSFQDVTTQLHAALTLLRTVPSAPARAPQRNTRSGPHRVV